MASCLTSSDGHAKSSSFQEYFSSNFLALEMPIIMAMTVNTSTFMVIQYSLFTGNTWTRLMCSLSMCIGFIFAQSSLEHFFSPNWLLLMMIVVSQRLPIIELITCDENIVNKRWWWWWWLSRFSGGTWKNYFNLFLNDNRN